MMTVAKDEISIHFVIQNSSDHSLVFVIEPWGDIKTLLTGARCEITASGPDTGIPEFVYRSNSITYYGWPGSIVTIDGEEQIRSPGPEAYPKRMETPHNRQPADDSRKPGAD